VDSQEQRAESERGRERPESFGFRIGEGFHSKMLSQFIGSGEKILNDLTKNITM
jgi:hypothetical protein